jgi:hypothetical protein
MQLICGPHSPSNVERLIERPQRGLMRRFNPISLFTLSTKFKLPTAIPSDYRPSLAVLSHVSESSTRRRLCLLKFAISLNPHNELNSRRFIIPYRFGGFWISR